LQPNPESGVAAGDDHLSYFALLARIVGFAIFHGETIPAHWSDPFIKAAFGFPLVSKDLESVEPELYKNHVQLIENYDASEHGGMSIGTYWREELMVGDLVFAADRPLPQYSDNSRKAKRAKLDNVELKPGGAKVKVTEANKAEYVKLFVQHRLVGAIQPQIEIFQQGLAVFFSSELLERLRAECTPADIKLMLCGADEIDVDDWEQSCEYQGGFTKTCRMATWFWSVVRGMTPAVRSKLLDFCTGSARAPATGFSDLLGYSGNQHRFRLQQVEGEPERLPSAATCFNTLRMPTYVSEEQLKLKLMTAINGAQGFDEAAVQDLL